MGDFFSDFRECPLADDGVEYPMTQKGADTPGAFVVPSGAQHITAIKINVSGIVTDVVTGNTTSIRLVGLPGLQNYAGPLLSTAGAAATSGGFAYNRSEVYQTKIPVNNVSQFDARCCFNGDDPGTLHMSVTIEYDGVPGRVVYADVREIAIGAAANTLLALTTRTDTANTGNFKGNGGKIVEIHFGAALDPTGDAANGLVWLPAFEIDGQGLVTSNKPLTMVGPSGPTQPDTDVAGNQNTVSPLEVCVPGNGVLTKSGGDITVRAQNIESINPGQAICCLCFG